MEKCNISTTSNRKKWGGGGNAFYNEAHITSENEIKPDKTVVTDYYVKSCFDACDIVLRHKLGKG